MRNNFADCDAQPSVIVKHDAIANAACTAIKAANAEQFWVIDWIAYSYSGIPTGGRLTVTFGSTVLLDLDIAAAGEYQIVFEAPLYNPLLTKNEALEVTLAAAGGSVVGKVTARVR